MNDSTADRLSLDIEETSILYARLKREEDGLGRSERELLHKLEGFLYGFLSIDQLEALVVGGKVDR